MQLRAQVVVFAVAASVGACGPSPELVAQTQREASAAFATLDGREATWRETLSAFVAQRQTAGTEPCGLHLVDDLQFTAADLEVIAADAIPTLRSTSLSVAREQVALAHATLLLADAVTEPMLNTLRDATVGTNALGLEAVWLVQEIGYPAYSAEAGLTPGSFRGVLVLYDHDREAAQCAAVVRETNAPDVVPQDPEARAPFDASPETYLLEDLYRQAFRVAVDTFMAVPAGDQ